MLHPEQYLLNIRRLFAAHGNPAVAEGQMNYMRNQFEFFGLKAPEWMALAKNAFQEWGMPQEEDIKTIARLCYEDEHREMQFFAIEMVQRELKKQPEDFFDFLEELITAKSWWDTVDWLAKIAGEHFRRFPHLTQPVTERWMESGNIWLQRSAIIFQLRFREKTDARLLFTYILRVAGSKEFFLQKGAGWALREYSKTDPEAVRDFVRQHPLAPLTKREALKWLNRQL